MNKILKYSIIGIVVLVALSFFLIVLYPVVFHSDCYLGGGRWTTCSNTCQDFCGYGKGSVCGAALTPCCDCGTDKCWNGKKCVPDIEKYCEVNEDCIGSCGSVSGFTCTGTESYNINYLKSYYQSNNTLEFDGSIDNACCVCDCADGAFVSKCVNNICTSQLV